MQKIRRNDQVTVLTGRDKGKRGEVLRVLDNGRALVSGVNIVKKHTRPDPYRGIQGGIVEKRHRFSFLTSRCGTLRRSAVMRGLPGGRRQKGALLQVHRQDHWV